MKFEVKGAPPEVLWATPIEAIWNSIVQTSCLNRILKRPDIGLSHRFANRLVCQSTCLRATLGYCNLAL